MNALFDVQSYYQPSRDRDYIDQIFCGISQNARMAANAFGVVHNLICEWGRGRGGSRTSYCMGVAKSFMSMTKDTWDQETLEMIKLDQEDLRTQVVKEQQEERERLDRLDGTCLAGAAFRRFGMTEDFDENDNHIKRDQAYDASSDTSEEFFNAREQIHGIDRPTKLEKQNQLDQVTSNTPAKILHASNANALTAYRGTAKDIADALIKSHGFTFSCRKGYSVKDRNAYQEGVRNARDIDVKRKRIENRALGDEIVGVG